MYLTKIKKIMNTTNIHVEFEQVATNLVMISVDNDTYNQAKVFSYWRILGNGNNPPLEVGVSTDTGMIKSITFFVDIECFKELQLIVENISIGNILVNFNIFARQNDYVDTDGNYFVCLSDGKFICKFDLKCNIKESIVNGDLEFYVDENEQVIGFAINNLTESALKAVKSLL